MEILAAHSARWKPKNGYAFSCLRRSLAKLDVSDAIHYLQPIVKTGAVDHPLFQELMRTPRMKDLLKQSYPGVMKLREFAGYVGSRARKSRM